jgi:tetratricopeptide (TPR) repeat protein
MFGGAGILALSVLAYFRFSLPAIVAVVVVGLIPGRILGYFWRDLLRGLRLLNAKNYAASKFHSERFLVEVRKKPWIRHFIWLASSAYSRDPEVLALNNLGAAEIGLGKLDPARAHLREAIAKDALCPLPFYNLGVLFKAMNDTGESERCFAQATRLGLRHGISDKIVRASQTRFANTDGR